MGSRRHARRANDYDRTLNRTRRRHERFHRRCDSIQLLLQLPVQPDRTLVPARIPAALSSPPVFREFSRASATSSARSAACASNPIPKAQLVEVIRLTAYVAHLTRTCLGGLGQRHRELPLSVKPPSSTSRYYTPITSPSGIAGDVDPKEALAASPSIGAMIPAGPAAAARVRTVEPAQHGEKRVTVESPAQPFRHGL